MNECYAGVKYWFSKWPICLPPPRGLYQFCKGPHESDGKLGGHSNCWVGHRNFTVWIKISLVPCISHSTEGKVMSYCSSHILSCWLWFQMGNLFAVEYVAYLILWRERIFAYHWLHCGRAFETCKRSSGPRNTLNIMHIINNIFTCVSKSVLYLNKGFNLL